MVIVLVATRYQKILEWIQNASYENIKSIDVIKRNGAKVYLYVETTLSQGQVIKEFHRVVFEQCRGIYIYEVFGVYHGKIDFHSYLSDEAKDKMKYYHTKQKDISSSEIDKYKQSLS